MRSRRKKKRLSASKIVLGAILLICLEIIIYAEVAMLHLGDLSALYVLIGVPAAMMGTAWAYFTKSGKENSEGGIVYETALLDKKASLLEQQSNLGFEFIDLSKDHSVG